MSQSDQGKWDYEGRVVEAIQRLEAENAAMCSLLEVFASPRATSRTGDGETPEQDTMSIEVTAGDWVRACVLTGRMDADYLRSLPEHARPSEAFIASLPSPNE